jgi:hypothetical protein
MRIRLAVVPINVNGKKEKRRTNVCSSFSCLSTNILQVRLNRSNGHSILPLPFFFDELFERQKSIENVVKIILKKKKKRRKKKEFDACRSGVSSYLNNHKWKKKTNVWIIYMVGRCKNKSDYFSFVLDTWCINSLIVTMMRYLVTLILIDRYILIELLLFFLCVEKTRNLLIFVNGNRREIHKNDTFSFIIGRIRINLNVD